MTTQNAAEIFRDFETDGVPSSGTHAPKKSDIRNYLTEVEWSLDLVDAAIAADTATAIYRADLTARRILFHFAI